MFPDHNIWLQHVTQVYIKVHDIQRDVYVKHSDQFNLPQDAYLELLKPLYDW